jgi:hypothetical protein
MKATIEANQQKMEAWLGKMEAKTETDQEKTEVIAGHRKGPICDSHAYVYHPVRLGFSVLQVYEVSKIVTYKNNEATDDQFWD